MCSNFAVLCGKPVLDMTCVRSNGAYLNQSGWLASFAGSCVGYYRTIAVT